MAAKPNEWKGDGQEEQRIAKEKAGKGEAEWEQVKGMRHTNIPVSVALSGTLGFFPCPNTWIHGKMIPFTDCLTLLLSSEHCRPHLMHRNGLVFIWTHDYVVLETELSSSSCSLKSQTDRSSRIFWKSSPLEKKKVCCISFQLDAWFIFLDGLIYYC